MDASQPLLDLAFLALDHGIDSIERGGPLVPFLVIEGTAGESRLERFVTERIEDGPLRAREHLRELDGVNRVALAYDGYVTIEGQRSDAILVEAHERGRSASFVFAQRYRRGSRLRKVAPIGNAAFLGDDAPLLPEPQTSSR